jgi:hypothetical protein
MKKSAVVMGLLASMASPVLAESAPMASPSLRAIVDQIETEGSAIVYIDANRSVRLVRDQSRCAPGEELTLVWINFADRQHLAGYICGPPVG